MRLISWNTNHRRRQAPEQVRALLSRAPDLVALQEVIPSTVQVLEEALAEGGLIHSATTVGDNLGTTGAARSLGVLVASRYPLEITTSIGLALPWEEKSLSTRVRTVGLEFELHTVHIPPGSSNGWVKVEALEAVFASMKAARARILCGDFNCPQRELPTGELVTWAQRIDASGVISLRRQFRGGPGARWDAAERSVLAGLQEFGMCDVYRSTHGYSVDAHSWVLRRGDRTFGRRFDHVFASPHFRTLGCRYLDQWRIDGLSDHAAIEADFEVAI